MITVSYGMVLDISNAVEGEREREREREREKRQRDMIILKLIINGEQLILSMEAINFSHYAEI